MTHSSSIDLYKYSSKDSPLDMPPSPPSNVRGWLMGVPGYRDTPLDKHENQQIHQEQRQRQQNTTNGPLNSISNDNIVGSNNLERRKSVSSLASEDSVNLDDLIKANYTLDVDDETDLPSLSGLDLDDSNEDFWKMDKSLSDYQIKQPLKRPTNASPVVKEGVPFMGTLKDSEQQDYSIYTKDCRLDSWSPPADDYHETLIPSINSSHSNNNNNNNNDIIHSVARVRSGSINSDNSSTVTTNQYSRYGMAPMVYQSDSTSTSSRTASRLSNYSATSSQASSSNNTGLPRPRKVSASSTGMSSPSRSYSSRDDSHLGSRAHSRLGTSHLSSSAACTTNEGSPSTTNGRSKLAQRASHIPSPPSLNSSNNTISLPRMTSIPSSKSTGIPGARSASRFGEREGAGVGSRIGSTTTVGGSTTSRKLASRASHIPSLHERSSTPTFAAKSSAHSTIRNSVFGLRRDDDSTTSSASSPSTRRATSTSSNLRSSSSQQRQGISPSSVKSTSLRPPTDTRSSSRIGFRKL